MTAKPLSSKGPSSHFGYLPLPWSIDTERVSIQPLPAHQDIVASLTQSPNINRDWFYPGARLVEDIASGKVNSLPYPSRVFSLPETHVITLHEGGNTDDLDFVVWCLSFFVGMRLTTTQAGFLDATPVKEWQLVDFVLSRRSLGDALHMSLDYMIAERADPRATKRVAAVIHALFLAQRPQNLCFERFTYLYMALDACFSLLLAKEPKRPQVKHGDRIPWMCGKFKMPVPAWAASGKNAFSCVRNDTFHEALFFGQPLGFAVYGGNQPGGDPDNITLQMQALICRLLVGILGEPGASYVGSPVDTRQKHELELAPRST